MNEPQFVGGVRVYPPNDKAPDFIKYNLVIDPAALRGWLDKQGAEQIRVDLKLGRSGKPYLAVNDWRPQGGQQSTQTPAGTDDDFVDDPIPF